MPPMVVSLDTTTDDITVINSALTGKYVGVCGWFYFFFFFVALKRIQASSLANGIDRQGIFRDLFSLITSDIERKHFADRLSVLESTADTRGTLTWEGIHYRMEYSSLQIPSGDIFFTHIQSILLILSIFLQANEKTFIAETRIFQVSWLVEG